MAKLHTDYEYEATRHMCEGCNKVHGGGRTLLGFVCTTYLVKPSMYVRANECPMNKRIRKQAGRKVLVGQQKQGRF
jgi:hypothetical protein